MELIFPKQLAFVRHDSAVEPSFGSMGAREVFFRDLEIKYDVAEVRSMSKLSLLMRSLCLQVLREKMSSEGGGRNTGVYCLSEEAPPSSALMAALKDPSLSVFKIAKKTSAKVRIGAVKSMVATQVAIESKASRSVYCLTPSLAAVDLLFELSKVDFQSGEIEQAIFAFCYSRENENYQPLLDAGYVAVISDFSEKAGRQLSQDFQQFFKVEE